MGDDQENSKNKLFEVIKRHPKFAKWTGGGGGVLLFFLINRLTGFLEVSDFNNIIEWIKKLKSLIQGDYSLVAIIGIIAICVTICICKKMDNNVKVQTSAMKMFRRISKSDRPISGFNLINKKGITNISINTEQSNGVGVSKEKDNSKNNSNNNSNNIINFPSLVKNDEEVEE